MNDEAGTQRAETPSRARSLIAALSGSVMVALGVFINARWPSHPGVTPPAPALMVDFVLVAAYATFLIAMASAGFRDRPATRVLAIGAIVSTIIALVADVIENIYGLRFPNGLALQPATIATAVKWGYFFGAMLFAGAVTALRESRARQVGGALMVFAGALGFAGSVGGVSPLRDAGVVLATLGALIASLLPYVAERVSRGGSAADTASPWRGQLDVENALIDAARASNVGPSGGGVLASAIDSASPCRAAEFGAPHSTSGCSKRSTGSRSFTSSTTSRRFPAADTSVHSGVRGAPDRPATAADSHVSEAGVRLTWKQVKSDTCANSATS